MASLFVVGLLADATYTTQFPGTENPISEGGAWTGGATTGFDWSDVQTTPGLAFGTQTGFIDFNDSIAVLNGTWSADQSATAVVHTTNQQAGNVFEEVELLLRFTIAPHSTRGYELNFSMRNDGSQYAQIVRWNGALGDFTLLDAHLIPLVHDGDQVSGSIVGNTITTYLNGIEIFHVTDSTFTDGNPGMGFYLQGATDVNSDYGFTCFAAAAGGTPPACVAQTTTGRMTGGGKVLTPSGLVTFAFELRCDPADKRANLEVTWGGNRFHLDKVTAASCYFDPLLLGPMQTGTASFNTLTGRGTGRYNNAPGASASWTFTDAGEPGTNDTATIQITDSRNFVLLTASGRLVAGNSERHRD